MYGIQCSFGEFGLSPGVFINKTTIMCLTPRVNEDPQDYIKEIVPLRVTLNGQDYTEDEEGIDFAFIGTGSALKFWPWILAILLFGLLIVALILFCSALLNKVQVEKAAPRKNRPYVIRDAYDQFSSRAYSAGFMGRGMSDINSGGAGAGAGGRQSMRNL
jgi:hypothetical protein